VRAARIGLVAAILAALTGIVIIALPASAVVVPAPPYDLLTETGQADNAVYNNDSGGFILSGADSTITPTTTGEVFSLHAVKTGQDFTARFEPMVGATLAVGTFPVLYDATAAAASFRLNGTALSEGWICMAESGSSVTVSELIRDTVTHDVTAFALSYKIRCAGWTRSGEVRWHSGVNYGARTFSSADVSFGYAELDATSAPQTMTITSKGPLPVHFGLATLGGGDAGMFSIFSNTCANIDLNYGDTCAIALTAHPTGAEGFHGTTLTMPDNSAAGQVQFNVDAYASYEFGVSVDPQPAVFEGQQGGTAPTQTMNLYQQGFGTVTYGTATISGPDAAVFSIAEDTCSGQSLVPPDNSRCHIRISADTANHGTFSATLTLPDNSPDGQQLIPFTAIIHSLANATVSPPSIAVSVPAGTSSPAQTVTVTSTGTGTLDVGAATLGGANATAFSVVNNTCAGAHLAPSGTCTLGVVATAAAIQTYTATLTIADNTDAGHHTVMLSVTGVAGAKGTFYPLAPARIMDTRTGLGTGHAGALGQGTVTLQVSGRGGVPASGVGAVVLNVTVTKPTATSFLSVFPSGTSAIASNLNFVAGWTGANSVTVGLSSAGKVDIFNAFGDTHVIVDVVGFYAGAAANPPGFTLGGQFQPVAPFRMLDTRQDAQLRLGPGDRILTALDLGSANAHVRAFAVNVTAVRPNAAGYLAAWNGLGTAPTTSTLNFTAGKVVPNFAIVPTTSCTFDVSCAGMPMMGVYAGGPSSVDVLVDVVGFYDDSTLNGGMRFRPVPPTRIRDTRTMDSRTPLGPNTTMTFPELTVSSQGIYAIAVNLTAVRPTSNTFLSIWPGGLPQPTVSNLNPAKGQTVPNAAVTLVNINHLYNVYNSLGDTHVVIDLVGVFEPGMTASAATVTTGTPKFRFSPPFTAPLTAAASSSHLVRAGG
jgi:hypothetical protein